MEPNKIITTQLEKLIYYNKNKKKNKLLLKSLPLKKCLNKLVSCSVKILSFSVQLSHDNMLEKVKWDLTNSKIILSIDSNPQNESNYIVQIPGFLCGLESDSNSKTITVNIPIENFIPNNLPIDSCSFNQIYFFILFMTNTYTTYIEKAKFQFEQLKPIDITSKNFLNLFNILDSKDYFKFGPNNVLEIDSPTNNIYQFGQNTQIQNIKCKSEKFSTRVNFDNLCRGFWIKINSKDLDKLIVLKLLINGQDNEYTLERIYLLFDITIIGEYSIIFLNLECGSGNWELPKDFSQCKQIYSNSLNLSRIDSFKVSFEFNQKKFFNCKYITICSLYSNIIGINKSEIEKIK